ncbi:MAG: response regulator [Thermonemataceae bacterium]|nr:response regulator [Thermonemataceae bacterium]
MPNNKLYFVIDDDKINNLVCESVIRKADLNGKVMSFLRAEDALKYINNTSNQQPDVIFLDINMPGMDGWEFLEKYLQMPQGKAHIFMLSSSINQGDFEKAKRYPRVLDYIVKPFSKEKLQQSLELIA